MDVLRSWVVQEGATIADEIEARPIPEMGGGKGIVATSDISPGRLLVTVPQTLMLTTKRARMYLCSLKPCPSPAALKLLTPVECIMSFLLLAEQDATHPFYGWLRSLPRQYDNLLELPFEDCQLGADEPHDATHATSKFGMTSERMSCGSSSGRASSAESLAATYLWSPRCAAKVAEERLRFEASASRCVSVIPQLQRLHWTHEVFESASDSFTSADETMVLLMFSPKTPTAEKEREGSKKQRLGKFLWAYNSLMSRGFSYDEDIWAMMPWVDYFNYSLFPNVTMRYEAKRRRYEFIATRPIRAGEQLMLQYGKYSDFELALWYGFTLRRSLFPTCSAARTTTTMVETTDADDVSQRTVEMEQSVVQLNTHYAYVFSPTYDPNGDLPIGLRWAAELAEQSELPVPEAWVAETSLDPLLQDVRLAYGGANAGLRYYIRCILDAAIAQGNTSATSEIILRQIVESELRLLLEARDARSRAAAPAQGSLRHGYDATRIATQLSEDHVVLLERFASLTNTELRQAAIDSSVV